MDIAKRLKARRIELGLTQSQLATQIGFKNRSSIYQFESGDRIWRLDNFYRACQVLKLKILIEKVEKE